MGKSTQERLKSRQVADIPIREMQGRELAESMMNGPNEKLFKKHHELWIEIEEDDLESNDQLDKSLAEIEELKKLKEKLEELDTSQKEASSKESDLNE